MDAETLTKIMLSGGAVLLALLGWSLRQNLVAMKEAIDHVASAMRDLATRVGDHGELLARGDEVMNELVKRVESNARDIREIQMKGCARACSDD